MVFSSGAGMPLVPWVLPEAIWGSLGRHRASPPRKFFQAPFQQEGFIPFTQKLSMDAPEHRGELCRGAVLPIAALLEFPRWAAGRKAKCLHAHPSFRRELAVVWQQLGRNWHPALLSTLRSMKAPPGRLCPWVLGRHLPSVTFLYQLGHSQFIPTLRTLPPAEEEQCCRDSWLCSRWAVTHGSKTWNQVLSSLNDYAFNPAQFTSAQARNMARRIKCVMVNVINGYF